jgi:predicted dienelactone hydrolase
MMTFRTSIAALALTLPVALRAQVSEDTLALGGRTAVVWRSTSARSAPVVIFSHGLGGCPTQSRFLTSGLAAHGYVVIAPFHRDAGCLGKKPPKKPTTPFASPQRWSDRTYSDRADDVRSIVSSLGASPLASAVDLERVAVAGHSLGGYTALSVGGAWALMRMPNVRAVLAMAPYAAPFVAHGTLGELTVPVMFQSGALDDGITQTVRRKGGAFDSAGGPKYFVEFAGARHSSWGNKPNAAHQAMLAYAVAFLDRHVRGLADTAVLERRLTGVAELRASESR